MSKYIEHMDYIARMVEQDEVSEDWIVEQTQIAVALRTEDPEPVSQPNPIERRAATIELANRELERAKKTVADLDDDKLAKVAAGDLTLEQAQR